MLQPREAAAILAALLFWSEEMLPHGADFARPYFATLGLDRFEPLDRAALDALTARLRSLVEPPST